MIQRPTHVCTQCHDAVIPATTRTVIGTLAWLAMTLLGLVILWPMMIVGLAGLFWPRSVRCPRCKALRSTVPLDSLRGRELLQGREHR